MNSDISHKAWIFHTCTVRSELFFSLDVKFKNVFLLHAIKHKIMIYIQML